MQKILMVVIIILCLSDVLRSQEAVNESPTQSFPVLKGSYLGQKAPIDEAEIFLDTIISTLDDPEMNAAFTADGYEFYYCARFNGNWAIYRTLEVEGRWQKPKPLAFTSHFTDRDFTMAPDGNRIYFGSNRPKTVGGPEQETLDIFVTEKLPSGRWSEPVNIGPPVNTVFGENYPSVASNGNLYFFSCRDDGFGGCDIYYARFVDGHYMAPDNLGSAINSDRHDWDSFIAPDESYIIFSSKERDDTVGGQDLYISYRRKDKTWIPAVNMGPCVNSVSCEICPSVSLDGKYLFFTSRRRGKSDIFWITTDIIQRLRPADL